MYRAKMQRREDDFMRQKIKKKEITLMPSNHSPEPSPITPVHPLSRLTASDRRGSLLGRRRHSNHALICTTLSSLWQDESVSLDSFHSLCSGCTSCVWRCCACHDICPESKAAVSV
jgi:hypothetical protein